MDKQVVRDALGWGIVLWLIGYTLGIILFFILPPSLLGWVIMPVGILITVWVLFRRVLGDTFPYYAILALAWTAIAVVFDYIFIVVVLMPADGYYKLDVYLYYVLTFILPLIAGGWKQSRRIRT